MMHKITSLILNICLLSGAVWAQQPAHKFPASEAGLTERQAAAHLLSRFTYGATQEEIDQAVKQGLESWFDQQLKASHDDSSLQKKLQKYSTFSMTNEQIVKHYFRNGEIVRMAIKEGVISDSVITTENKKQYRNQLRQYTEDKGIEPEGEMVKDFVSQKIVRSVYSKNQLQEVLTEFWFNHFNVSFTKGNCAKFIPAYERDVLRPLALDNFETLLIGTAKSPAMLMYLDNFSSMTEELNKKLMQNKKRGLNENYARELMELHTLGVDGGYTQQDVVNVARILTGWTVHLKQYRNNKTPDASLHEGDFAFTPRRHDTGEKTVMGKRFPANGGYEEGVTLLNMLANHISTAKFISKKLAVRFVSDNPPASLVEKMSKRFIDTKGDIKAVLITMVTSKEFWDKDAVRQKTKSPFELAISAIRATNSQVAQPFHLYRFATRMGQKMYHYQAPTGFPDQGKFWINTGALLNRMNFGMVMATGKIPGVKTDLLALNDNHEPESSEDALKTYCSILLPERNTEETVSRLVALVNDPEIETKINKAANDNRMETMPSRNEMTDDVMEEEDHKDDMMKEPAKSEAYGVAEIVGIIIGSPEFQRR